MGRTRRTDTHLPKRLFFRHGAYFYVTAVDGKSLWEPMGRDLSTAVAATERLNAMQRDQRLQTFRTHRTACDQLRDQILERDGYRCVYCGSSDGIGIDHVVPHALGGATLPFNLVCACSTCNSGKGMGDPRELVLSVMGLRQAMLDYAITFIGQKQ